MLPHEHRGGVGIVAPSASLHDPVAVGSLSPMATRAAIALAALAAGCALPETLWLEPPPATDGARTLILFFDGPEHQAARAFPLEAAAPALHFPIPEEARQGQARILALYYPSSAAELELEPGAIPMGPARPCALGAPLAVFATVLGASGAGRWSAEATLPSTARAHLLGPADATCRPKSACRDFVQTEVPLPVQETVQLLIPLGEERVLAATWSGTFFEATPALAVLRPDLDGLPSRSSHRGQGGTIWLGGTGGLVAHGPLEGPFVIEEAGLPDELITALASTGEGSSQRILALAVPSTRAQSVALLERAAGAWTRVFEEGVLGASERRGRIVVLRPDLSVTAYGGPSLLLRQGDRVRPLVIQGLAPTLESAGLVAHAEGFGLVIGANDGRLYAAGEEPFTAWHPLPGANFFHSVETMITSGTSILAGSRDGQVAQVHLSRESCRNLVVRADIRVLAEAGRSVVVGGSQPSGSPVHVLTWLTERTSR